MPQSVQSLNIEINGRVNPQVLRMISDMEKRLKDFGASTRTQSAVLNRFYSQAFDGANKAARTTDKLAESMKRVAEVAGGFSIGEMISSGLEEAAHLIERMADGMKEFAKSSLEVRATREVLQNQQKAMLESMGRGGQFVDIDTMIRNAEGRETMIKYSQLMATSNLLMSSDPARFNTVEKLHKELGQLSDISKDPTTFDAAARALSRIYAEGRVDAQHLRELSVDTGYNFKSAMAKAAGVTPDVLTDMMSGKHGQKKLASQATEDLIQKALDIITGPGGAAFRHAEAQLKGLEGIWSRFLGHWEDFEESFGKQLENFLQPIAEKIFDLLTPAELTHAFDQFEDMMRGLGETVADFVSGIASYMDVVGGPDVLRHLQGVGDAFGQIIKHVTGGFDPDTMFSDAEIPGMGGPGGQYSGGNYKVLNATGDAWVKSFTVGIDSALDKIKEFGFRVDALRLGFNRS